MFDFLQFIYELRHKPLGFIVLAACIFIVDRLFRNLITSQVKRLFRVNEKHELAAYEARQIHIEQMVEKLCAKEGIEWGAPISDARQQVSATRSAPFSSWHSIMLSLVQHAKKYIQLRRDHMSNINRGILLPLLSAIALFVKQVWGFEINDEQINMYADIALYLIMFIGLFMKPRKEKQKNVELDFTDGPAA